MQSLIAQAAARGHRFALFNHGHKQLLPVVSRSVSGLSLLDKVLAGVNEQLPENLTEVGQGYVHIQLILFGLVA